MYFFVTVTQEVCILPCMRGGNHACYFQENVCVAKLDPCGTPFFFLTSWQNAREESSDLGGSVTEAEDIVQMFADHRDIQLNLQLSCKHGSLTHV